MQSIFKYKDGKVALECLTQVKLKSYSLNRKEKCIYDHVHKKGMMHANC